MIEFDFKNFSHDILDHTNDENINPAITFLNQWMNGEKEFPFTSSGSTGKAKKIILSRNFLIESAQRTITLFNIKSNDTLLLALNTSFMGGMMMLVRALVAECKLIYIAPQSLNATELSKLQNIKLASFVPSQMMSLLNEHSNPFEEIKYILIGGASINKEVQTRIEKLNNRNTTFFHTYGMTETASHVALKNISQKESYYTALKGYRFDIDDRSCLNISHENGLNFQTNDIVNIISETAFEWIGRADWIVNSGGIKFSIESAEEIISQFFNETQCSLNFTSYKITDLKWGEKWVLIIETSSPKKINEEALVNYCKQQLGKYIYPREIIYTKKIVYLPSGKVDRLKTYSDAI